MHGKQWDHAFLDTRRPATCTTQIYKLRMVSPDGSVYSLLDTPLEDPPPEVMDLIHDLWGIKDEAFPDKWYGLKFKVFPSGKCEVRFNYDPECALDPTFFDD